jgi:hypothetical protein
MMDLRQSLDIRSCAVKDTTLTSPFSEYKTFSCSANFTLISVKVFIAVTNALMAAANEAIDNDNSIFILIPFLESYCESADSPVIASAGYVPGLSSDVVVAKPYHVTRQKNKCFCYKNAVKPPPIVGTGIHRVNSGLIAIPASN